MAPTAWFAGTDDGRQGNKDDEAQDVGHNKWHNTPKIVTDRLCAIDLMTKMFMPTGGVIRPSSTVITMMMPNQIGSKPSAMITGKRWDHQDDHGHGVKEAAKHYEHRDNQPQCPVRPKAEIDQDP